MIFDWRTNTEIRLPNIPNGVRVSSPFSASAVTLPLTPANNYTPEILICGGTAGISDKLPWIEYSSQRPNSDQCARMVLSKEGIKAGWKVEHMPEGRIMLELILIPDGRVVIVNGAKTGVAGWGTVHDPVGLSNADHPGFTPIVYDPSAPAGKRFSKKDMPTSKIARMYHSTATLIPDGSIMIGGSNPNPFTNTSVPYPSEWRLEFLSPPYMSQQRPTVSGVPKIVDFGRQFTLNVNLPRNTRDVVVNLMDLGFATHGVHMDQKLVQLKATLSRDKKTIKVTAPSDGRLYSPGPGFLYVVTDKGIPSVGHRLIIGNGRSPSVDQEAITNMLANTGEADPWYEDP
ncbi:hypothetical protein ONZ45_g16339 [Pleurotus djamor]|nr:hypothetical protein ONZ45_g16339 [Pleurotus djamor]